MIVVLDSEMVLFLSIFHKRRQRRRHARDKATASAHPYRGLSAKSDETTEKRLCRGEDVKGRKAPKGDRAPSPREEKAGDRARQPELPEKK